MSNPSEILDVLEMLADTYPRFGLSERTVAVYTKLLDDIPIELLRAAAVRCAADCDFFPSVHELRGAVSGIRRIKSGIPTDYEAWQDLLKAIPDHKEWVENPDDKEYGGYFGLRAHKFIHPIVRQVGEMLGWPEDFPGDNPTADRSHFIKAYNQAVEKMLDEENMPQELKDFINASSQVLLGEGGKP